MLQSIIGSLPAGESIDFQKGSRLAKELVEEVDRLIPEIKPLGDWPDPKRFGKILNSSKMSEIILEYTGLNIVFGFHEALGAAVYPPSINKDASITTGMFSRYKKSHDFFALKDKVKEVQIDVDLKRGYVYGVEKIKTKVIISNHFFINHTAKGIAAVLLHEVGHLVSLYYSLTSSSVPNFLLTEFTDRLFDLKSEAARTKLVSEIDGKLIDLKDQKKLINAEDKEDARLVIIDNVKRANRSQFGNDFYDKRAWEAMADNFVVKHGLFYDLAVVLKDGNINSGRTVMQFIITLVELLPPVLLITFIAHWSNEGGEYDEPIKRLEVIRKQAIAGLKTAGDDEGRELLKDIDKMTKLIGDDKEFISLGKALVSLFTASGREKYNSVRTQQALEHFSHSEFNVLREKLKQL